MKVMNTGKEGRFLKREEKCTPRFYAQSILKI